MNRLEYNLTLAVNAASVIRSDKDSRFKIRKPVTYLLREEVYSGSWLFIYTTGITFS